MGFAGCRPLAPEMRVCEEGRIRLVAGGGFEPQSRIDSTQVIDSVIRENGTIGKKGKSVLHFFYTLPLEPGVTFLAVSALPPTPCFSTQSRARITWVLLFPLGTIRSYQRFVAALQLTGNELFCAWIVFVTSSSAQDVLQAAREHRLFRVEINSDCKYLEVPPGAVSY